MSKNHTRLLALLTMMVGLFALPAFADDQKGDPKASEAIQKQAEAFVEAFHRGDAKAVAAFWTADGDYADQTGRVMKGREAIEKAFASLFAENKGLKVRINSDSLRFVTPDVAIEDGTTEVFPPDGLPPSRARYTIVHVKKDGQWLMSSIREAAMAPSTNNEHLQGLEWAIGDWAGETEKGEAERISVAWNENQSFLVASFATTFKGAPTAGAKQWIGWDPVSKQIRAWIFDSTGGFGDGTLTSDGNRWVNKISSVLNDGKKATATYIVKQVDADTVTCQFVDRTVDGKSLPDTKEVKMKRIK